MTVSCLPRFAQPYRVVCNATIEAFFEGSTARSDVRGWSELLGRYRRAYQQWFGTLRMECGALFGRSPPEENALIFWARIMEACGGVAAATGKLVGQLRVTLFGRYRCHQRRIFQAKKRKFSGYLLFGVNPHRTGLWHKVQPAANALGHDRKGPPKSFGAFGADPPQCRQLD